MWRDHLRGFPFPVILIEPPEPFQVQTERRPRENRSMPSVADSKHFSRLSRQVSVRTDGRLLWLPLGPIKGQEKDNVGDCAITIARENLGWGLDPGRAYLGDGGYGARSWFRC
jgi:hypothetical protein